MLKALVPISVILLAGMAHAQVPDWIWHGADAPGTNEVRFFRKTFSCAWKPQRADFVCTADDEFTLYLNGRKIAEGANWKTPVTLDLREHIQQGENVFAARVRNHTGPAGLLAKLELRSPNNSGVFILTDKSWTSSAVETPGWETRNLAATDWKPARSLGKAGVAPWGEVFSKPTATPAASLTLPPGFQAELLKSADATEGSWICMTIDHQGRFIISPEKYDHPLLRITLGSDGQVAKTEAIAEPMRGAMGLLYAHDSLYVNGRGPDGGGLYRLIDRNNNDRFEPDEITLLKKFEGDNEHGYHAVVLGPDQQIYVINGNMTRLPEGLEGLAPDSPHRNFAEDLLLPRLWDANGHAKGILAPGGHVLRTDPAGQRWELLLGGFRNAYDIDFNADGEMFTFDSDMEWDIGAPWYRPTRINHCVSGGEYGWRSGSGKWPESHPDSLPGTLDTGLSSPTGVKFGTGSKFPPKYQQAFYALDWAYGKIFAVHLTPHGASYTGEFETFVSGRPLAVVDVEFGPDGAMYFITGGWRTQSGFYRVSYTGAPREPERLSRAEQEALDVAAKQRGIRRKLESFHGRPDPGALDFAWGYLGSDDRWLRFAARVAVESQEVGVWRDRALAETKPGAALSALLALVRTGDRSLQAGLLQRLTALLEPGGQGRVAAPAALTHEQHLELLRVLQLCFIRMGAPDTEAAAHVTRALLRLYPAPTEAANRELCQLLVYLDAPEAVARTLALLEAAPAQEEQMHYAFVLRNATNGWTPDQRKTYFNWFNKALAEYSGGNSFDKFLINIRNEALDKLSPAERTEIAALIKSSGPPPVPVPTVVRGFVREWTLDDLAPSVEQVDSGRSFASGREAFISQCAPCHRVGKLGASSAPDLTGVSGRFGRRDLLDHIVDPSKVISDRFQNVVITTRDDEEFIGCVTEETEEKVVLIVNLMTGDRQEILQGDIALRETATISPMPTGLLDVLTKEEILDLLAYLESDGRAGAPAFASTR